MLGKVLKYDLMATGRQIIPAYLVFIVITVLNKICLEISILTDFETPSLQLTQVFTFILYFITLFVISIVTTVFLVMYFYKTMAGNQGYLTHTLPAKTEVLVLSKIICSLIWQLTVTVLISLSILFLLFGHIKEISAYFSDFWGYTQQRFLSSFNLNISIYSVLLVISSIVNAILGPVTYLACIAFGNLSNKHKVACATFSYVGLYIVLKIVNLIADIVFDVTEFRMDTSAAYGMTNVKTVFDIIFNMAVTAALYLLAVHIFKKRLNLE